MKHSALIVLAAALVCAACGGLDPKQQEVADVALPYLEATANYHLDDARPYASPETQLYLDDAKLLLSLTDTHYIAANQPAIITITTVEFTSDTSATVLYHKKTPIKEKDSQLKLRKRDGKWQVYAPRKQQHTGVE